MVPLNFHLSALQAGHAPQAYFSDAGKVGKSAPGRPRPPFFYPIVQYQGRYPVATEFPLGRWPLVIGAVGIPLRLTALGMMDFAIFCYRKPGCFPKEQAAGHRKTSCLYPFKKATAEAGQATRHRSDARRILQFSGCAAARLIPADWANKGGLGSPQRRFGYFAAEGKVTRAGARNTPSRLKV